MTDKRVAITIGVCVLVAIGVVMSMQPVSLMTGSGQVWMGVLVVAAGTAAAFFLGAPKGARVFAVVFLAVALVNAFDVERQMSEKRQEITHTFDNLRSKYPQP